ncbi:MAG: hypothetical protein ACUVRD_06770 [Bacteroidia bacterium]
MKPVLIEALIAVGAISLLWVQKVRNGIAGAGLIFFLLAVDYFLRGQSFIAMTQGLLYLGGILVFWVWGLVGSYTDRRRWRLWAIFLALGISVPWFGLSQPHDPSFTTAAVGAYFVQGEGALIFLGLTFLVVGVLIAVGHLWQNKML